MRTSWSRLLPRHHRIVPFWLVAGIAVAAPWLIAEDGRLGEWFRTANQGTAATCTISSIYDGDTMRATCDGERLKIRVHCIDAPEMAQRPWGKESRDHLRRITPPTIELRRLDTDRYGRIVGEVFDPAAPDVPINLAMVRDGQAAVYRRYCSDGRYLAAEREARDAGLGIWSRPGDQRRPWEYRRR